MGKMTLSLFYAILKQEGNMLSGSVGPNENEQDSFEGGKVDGDNLGLTFHKAQMAKAQFTLNCRWMEIR
jgi:hypothetical protein